MSNAVRIHHFAKSGHAHRALVFAKLAGIAHEAVPVDLAAGAHKSPEFLAMNPNGQVPVLEDGDVICARFKCDPCLPLPGLMRQTGFPALHLKRPRSSAGLRLQLVKLPSGPVPHG